MFYKTETNDHGMKHDPFKAIVAPRPIGWISSVSSDGKPNLAPYSFFNAIGAGPKFVMFSSGGIKDSARNVLDTGEFVCNYVSRDLFEKMSMTSVPSPHGVDEFELAGLTPLASEMINVPRVGEAVAALECKLTQHFQPIDIEGKESDDHVIIGQVVGIHIAERVIENDRFSVTRADPVTRLGYMDYGVDADIVEMFRPDWPLKS